MLNERQYDSNNVGRLPTAKYNPLIHKRHAKKGYGCISAQQQNIKVNTQWLLTNELNTSVLRRTQQNPPRPITKQFLRSSFTGLCFSLMGFTRSRVKAKQSKTAGAHHRNHDYCPASIRAVRAASASLPAKRLAIGIKATGL
jgi:hypothetical protein